MVSGENLKEPSVEENARDTAVSKRSLLSKYEVPVQHLDFSYVEKCADGKELEQILLILQSKEEGYFPDLIEAAERRLREIKPKSKLLRVTAPVLRKEDLKNEEMSAIKDDLGHFLKNVNFYNKELQSRKCKMNPNLPEIRQKLTVTQNKQENKIQRIKSTDYDSWDKYDPDSEIIKMDIQEEQLKKHATQTKNKKEIEFKTEFTTDVEATIAADKQRIMGNEFFKVGDYQEAIKCYTSSIKTKATAVAYTNRALCYIKTKIYKKSLDDCTMALEIDKNNIKALLRKAESEEKLENYHGALKSVDAVLKIQPNNCVAQEIANRLAKYRKNNTKKTRLKIEEIESNKKPIFNCEIIAIPGTSKMPPPYYQKVHSKDPKIIREEIKKVYNVPRLMYIATIDNSSEDESNQKDDENSIKQNSTNMTVKSKFKKSSIKRRNKTDVSSIEQKSEILLNDRGAGGEPCTKNSPVETVTLEDLNSPYTFLKTWNSVEKDSTYTRHAEIVKNLDKNRIVQIIGYKLDSTMLSNILKCMCLHLRESEYLEIVYSVLVQLTEMPRFNIIKMFLTENDFENFSSLRSFLQEFNFPLEDTIVEMYTSSD